MSYYVAQPVRSIQDHAKRVDHVVVELVGYGRPGLTACGLEFRTEWKVEKIDQAQLEKRKWHGLLCRNCVKKSDRWVTM